jgi:DNA-binding response OmpR family regulator
MRTSSEPVVSTNQPGPSSNAPLVLIADDDRTLRKLLNLALQQEGYRVAQASNGEQVIQDFERLHPDLLLLDAVMPDRDGFDCCRHLRTVLGSDIPILMVTVLDDQDSVDRAFDAGATDYITKPIHWAVLSQRVKRLVSSDRALKQIQTLQAQLHLAQLWETLQQQILAIEPNQANQPLAARLGEVLPSLQQVFKADGVWLYDGATSHMQKLDESKGFAKGAKPVAANIADMLSVFPAHMGEGLDYPQGADIETAPAILEQLQALAAALPAPAVLMSPIVQGSGQGWLFMVRRQVKTWTPAERHRIKTLTQLLELAIASGNISPLILGNG